MSVKTLNVDCGFCSEVFSIFRQDERYIPLFFERKFDTVSLVPSRLEAQEEV